MKRYRGLFSFFIALSLEGMVLNMDNFAEIKKSKKEKLLPSKYNSVLPLGAEIDLADQRYRLSGGALQLGYVERDNIFVFTYGRSAEEEKNVGLLRSRNRLGLLGVSLMAESNGVILYNGSIGRPIRTSMNFNSEVYKNKIIRLKHERYSKFRYSVESFNISHITHDNVPMTREVTAAIDELFKTGKVSIHNLAIIVMR